MKNKMKKKGRRRKIFLVVVIILVVLSLPGCVALYKEHREVRALTLDGVDFSRLKDGVYPGGNPGGLYGWRASRVEVTVQAGRVEDIEIIASAEEADFDLVARQIIHAQSLDVDGISGASLTTRAFLKGVETALIPAVR
jgi:uncharacterized protein with FMN-binding domain